MELGDDYYDSNLISNLDTFEYNLDYFSGAQAAIYIEHVLVDEITSIQWTVQQSKIPIYGYASQMFDEMANGTIIVQGSFSINFTHSGYLWSILQERYNKKPNRLEKIEAANKERIKHKILDSAVKGRVIGDRQDYHAYIESIKGKEADELVGVNITKYMNDIVWGPDSNDAHTIRDPGTHLRTDRRILNGFDIYLQFQHEGAVAPTVRKIEDVHLIGKGQTVVIDENPIQEVYSFYAKNAI